MKGPYNILIVAILAAGPALVAQDFGTQSGEERQVPIGQQVNQAQVRQAVSPELLYNEATVLFKDGKTTTGLYEGLEENSVCLLVRGVIIGIPLSQIDEFTIEVDREAWKGAVSGMVLAYYFGNLVAHGNLSDGYLTAGKEKFDPEDLGFLALGASLGYVLGVGRTGNETLTMEGTNLKDSLSLHSEFVEFLTVRWQTRWTFFIEGGEVSTREERSLGHYGTPQTVNFLRRFQLNYRLKDYLSCGVALVRTNEMSYQSASPAISVTEGESFNRGTLIAATVEISPPGAYIPSWLDIGWGFGFGLMSIDYTHTTFETTPTYYWFSNSISSETISKWSLGASVHARAGVRIHSGLSLSFFYDYTCALGTDFP